LKHYNNIVSKKNINFVKSCKFMTDEQVKEQIEQIDRVTKEICKSKEAAYKFLRDAGIPVGDEPFGTQHKKAGHA
jgi:hypothetical protein